MCMTLKWGIRTMASPRALRLKSSLKIGHARSAAWENRNFPRKHNPTDESGNAGSLPPETPYHPLHVGADELLYRREGVVVGNRVEIQRRTEEMLFPVGQPELVGAGHMLAGKLIHLAINV